MNIDKDYFESFISEFTKKYPQVSEDGKINYIFGGSFALNCYNYANSNIQLLSIDNENKILGSEEERISDTNKRFIEERLRPAGDIDMVLLSQEYINQKYGISYDYSKCKEMFSDYQTNYGNEDYKESVRIDPVEISVNNAVKTNIGNAEVVIESPKNLLAHKIFYTIRQLKQGIGNDEKTKSSIKDIYVLYNLSKQLYSDKELKETFIEEADKIIQMHEREGMDPSYFKYNFPLLKQAIKKYCGDKMPDVEEFCEKAVECHYNKLCNGENVNEYTYR